MFGFFKKKIHYSENIKNIFLKICSYLPKKYLYLYNQIEDGIIYDFKKEKDGFNKFIHYTDILNKYDDKNGNYFSLNKIILKDKKTLNKSEIKIQVGYGSVIGFIIGNEELLKTDCENIDIDILNMETEVFEDKSIKKIFSKEELKYINLNDVYEVELDGVLYYHIYDLKDENGDFIGIDEKKNVYKITHDPYEIILLSNSLIKFFCEKDN